MDEKSSEYWRRQARRYDLAAKLLNRRFSDMAQLAANAVDGAHDVLEVAAGTGLVTEVVAPRVERYVATDASVEMLDLLRRRLSAASNIEMQIADAMKLDFADGSFDAVIIANLLHLLDNPAGALFEARRVLRPGGKLIVPTFAHGQGLLANVVSRILKLSGFPVVTRFAGEQLDALVSKCGFQIVEARWFAGILPIRFVSAKAM